jgi:hypothetical protein
MRRFSLRRLIAAVAILAAIGGAYAYIQRLPLIDVFGGLGNVNTVRRATKVEAALLAEPVFGRTPNDEQRQNWSPSDYPINGDPVVLSRNAANEVSQALTSTRTYAWDSAKSCIPIYGLKLSFIDDTDRVDVYLCFECDILAVAHNDKIVGGEDFDNAPSHLCQGGKTGFSGGRSDSKPQRVRQKRS